MHGAADRRGDDGGSLGEAVPLLDRDASARLELSDQVLGQRSGTESSVRTEASFSLTSSLLTQTAITGGATGTHRDLLGRDEPQRLIRVEPSPEHKRGALQQHLTEHRIEAVDMEQREDAEHDIVTATGGGLVCDAWSMFASSARWLSIAARGRPLVPDV